MRPVYTSLFLVFFYRLSQVAPTPNPMFPLSSQGENLSPTRFWNELLSSLPSADTSTLGDNSYHEDYSHPFAYLHEPSDDCSLMGDYRRPVQPFPSQQMPYPSHHDLMSAHGNPSHTHYTTLQQEFRSLNTHIQSMPYGDVDHVPTCGQSSISTFARDCPAASIEDPKCLNVAASSQSRKKKRLDLSQTRQNEQQSVTSVRTRRRSPLDIQRESQTFQQKFNEEKTADWIAPYPSREEYKPKWESELKYAPTIEFHHAYVPENLSSEQKLFIVERIHRVRPFTEVYIRQQIYGRIERSTALDLVSQEEGRVLAAIEELFPRAGTQRRSFIHWMTNLSDAERVQVIDKLASATLQRADHLRDLLIIKQTSPGIANMILDARTPEEVYHIAHANGKQFILAYQNDRNLKRKETWQKGLSEIQRTSLLQRMVLGGVASQNQCYGVFARGKDKIPHGYGLHMLRASERDFRRIMLWLRGYPQVPERADR
jgi:hypothetical protein